MGLGEGGSGRTHSARRARRVSGGVVWQAGSITFFTEALVHGTAQWAASHPRRVVLYKYSAKHIAQGLLPGPRRGGGGVPRPHAEAPARAHDRNT